MSNVLLSKIFGVSEGYDLVDMEEDGESICGILMVKESLLVCPKCQSTEVIRRGRRWRQIQTVPIGLTPVFLKAEVPKCCCKKCHKTFEVSPPLPRPIEGSPIEWWTSRKGSPK